MILSLNQLANSKYFRTAHPNAARVIQEEFGDTTTAIQYAQVKLLLWNNECNCSIRYVDPNGQTPTVRVDLSDGTRPNQLIYDFPDVAIHIWSQDADVGMEFGGHNYAIVLKTKPASNVLNFTVRSKGLAFFKQLALTQAQIDAGASQPANVVNSYAVYYTQSGDYTANGGKNYAAGKAFHLYRVGGIDSAQNKAWCDQTFTVDPITGDGTYQITIPLGAYNNATYPVLIV